MKLKKFIEKHKVSVALLAKSTGLSVPTIISYVEEKRMPSVENAFKIQEATLGIVQASDFVITKKKRAARTTL